MRTSMIKPMGYLLLRWRSLVALVVGILAAMVMLLFATTFGQSPAQAAASPPPPQHIAAGEVHSLAIMSDGTDDGNPNDGYVYSWGGGRNGQLGVNSDNDHHTPVQVHGPGNVGYLSNVTYVDAGQNHSLAIMSDGTDDGNLNDGTVWAWGDNYGGKLGVNSNNDKDYPVQVHGVDNAQPPNGLSDIVAVAAGYDHSLALASDGTVYAWGDNIFGALGVNSNNDHYYPVQVHGPGNVGYLGDGTEGPSKTAPIVDVSAYGHSLALASDGHVYAWGKGDAGELGVNSDNHHQTPVQVHGPGNAQPPNGLRDIVDVATGLRYSLAIMSDGTDDGNPNDGYVYSWGDNAYGQLGVGTYGNPYRDTWGREFHDNRYYPVQVHGYNNEGYLSNVTYVDGGLWHSVAVQTPGVLWAWGNNMYGQLGLPREDLPMPTPMYVGPFTSVAAGGYHTLGVSSNGGLWAWGANGYGQLGDGTTTGRDYPVQVGGLVGGPPQEDTINPWVTQVVPADAATGVRRNSKVIASFSERMDAATINQQTFTLMKEGATTTEVAAKVSYNSATKEATLNPNKPLSKGESYTATVSTGAKDLAGNQLDQDHTGSGDPREWSFTVKN